jgi:hypothetical protein
VDFLVGIADDGEELVSGVALGVVFAAGEEDLVGDADALGFGVGDTVFSVVTETVGSVLFSGAAAGDGLSSWPKVNGTAAAVNNTAKARTVIFILFLLIGFLGGKSEPSRL